MGRPGDHGDNRSLTFTARNRSSRRRGSLSPFWTLRSRGYIGGRGQERGERREGQGEGEEERERAGRTRPQEMICGFSLGITRASPSLSLSLSLSFSFSFSLSTLGQFVFPISKADRSGAARCREPASLADSRGLSHCVGANFRAAARTFDPSRVSPFFPSFFFVSSHDSHGRWGRDGGEKGDEIARCM